jgi:DNA-directed RNA polymerase subunit RPC12/RpoP
MPMPAWYQEAKEKMSKVLSEAPPPMAPPAEFEKITDLAYLFAEYCIKGSDVLLHLFPRLGEADAWADGHYVNYCRNCKAQVAVDSGNPKRLIACSCCGHTGLIYCPGRAEEASQAAFPPNARDLIKEAVDLIWLGDVAVELIPELGAYVVQLQKAKSTANVIGLDAFVRKACEPLNELLAPKN